MGFDGSFLMSSAGGVLLSAIKRDANNQMFPISAAVMVNECTVTWSWFLSCFTEALRMDGQDGLVFIRDMQKVCLFFLQLFYFATLNCWSLCN